MAGSILTNIGLAKLASATPQDQLNITHIAVGDGNGGFPTLNPNATSLTNEVWRSTASNPIKDSDNSNYVYFETNITPESGPFDIREIAIFDVDGDMIAIGHTSLIQKPGQSNDSSFSVAVKIFISLSNASDFELIYQNAEVTSHNLLANRDAAGAHDNIYQRKIETVELLKSLDPNLYLKGDIIHCDERRCLWSLKEGVPPDLNDFWCIQSNTQGYYWEIKPTDRLSTFMFGYYEGMTGDLHPLLQSFDDYISTTKLNIPVSFIADGDLGSKLLLGNAVTGSRAETNTNINYELSLTTTYTDLQGYAVEMVNRRFAQSTGFIDVTCGGTSMGSRRQLGAVLASFSERCSLDVTITPIGATRYGVTFISPLKSTLSYVDYIRPIDCGLREYSAVSNVSEEGANLSQRSLLSLDAWDEYVDIGDILIYDGGEERQVATVYERDGSVIKVYPVLNGLQDGDEVKLNTGGGIHTKGGDSSLIQIGRVDGFRCGILNRQDALYPAYIHTLHGNGVGTGVTIGRQRNAAKGGGVGAWYLEGGGNIDMSLVETSTSIDGFTISSTMESLQVDNMINIAASYPNKNAILTRFLGDLSGSLLSIQQSAPANGNESNSSTAVSNSTNEKAVYYRNTGTVRVNVDIEMVNKSGRDYASILLMGGGAQGQPTGAITLTLESSLLTDGWLINGQSSLTLSGLTSAVDIDLYMRVKSKEVIAYRKDLILV